MDTGGSSSCSVNASYAQRNHLTTLSLTNSCPLLLGDGEARIHLTHMALVHSRIGNHYDSQWAYVMNMEGLDVIYGLPWIKHHSPTVLPGWDGLRFDSEYCLHVCNSHGPPMDVYCEESRNKRQRTASFTQKTQRDIQMVSANFALAIDANSTVVLTPKDFEDLEHPELQDHYRVAAEMTTWHSLIGNHARRL